MTRSLNQAVFIFDDGSSVVWRYIGKEMRLYTEAKKYAIQVSVEGRPTSIDQFFETFDKPSIHTAERFINNAIKTAKKEQTL